MTIFARVAVDILDHHRVLRIPRSVRASALGAWLAALVYSRKHELDGFCPADVVDVIAGEDVVEWLVKVDLFSRDEQDGLHGYLVSRYDQHNETKRQVLARLKADRVRKDAKRIPKGTQAASAKLPNGTPPDACNEMLSSGSVSVSSDLGSPTKPGSLLSTGASVSKDDLMPGELREAAAMLGVQDVDTAWRTFTGHYNGQQVGALAGGLAGAWQKWCAREAKGERNGRDKAAQRAGGMVQPAAPIRTWKVGDDQ